MNNNPQCYFIQPFIENARFTSSKAVISGFGQNPNRTVQRFFNQRFFGL